jgi:hypothetical protein
MVFMVNAMKSAKDAHQDNLRLNEIPKCVPPENNSTQISSVRQNQNNTNFCLVTQRVSGREGLQQYRVQIRQALSM